MRAAVRKIAICGYGLIGGSMALDFMKGNSSISIFVHDRKKVLDKLQRHHKHKVTVEISLPKAVNNSDIIILSAPHSANENLLERLSRLDLKDCLVIDTGAVKAPIARLGCEFSFGEGVQFLPTHPMAGKERAGFENASDNLFRDHAWYLDEEIKLHPKNRARLQWMVRKLKAVPTFISSSLHDRLVSEISHLPQLISTVLGAQIEPQLIELAGPGLRSMLRLSGSPYSVWNEIIDQNRKEILKTLKIYQDNLNKVARRIESKQSLQDIFTAAARSYKCLS